MKKLLILSLIAGVLLFAGCGKKSDEKTKKEGSAKTVATASKKMPQFEIIDIDGNVVKSEDLIKGKKVLILDFWATWCPPCRAEIPDFIKIYKEYKDKGVVVAGISLDKTIDIVKDFLKKNKISYKMLYDEGFKVQKMFGGIQYLPTTFVIDVETGDIVAKHTGKTEKDVFVKDINKILNKK